MYDKSTNYPKDTKRAICGWERLTDSLKKADDCLILVAGLHAAPRGISVLLLYIDVTVTAEWLAVTDVYNYSQSWQDSEAWQCRTISSCWVHPRALLKLLV